MRRIALVLLVPLVLVFCTPVAASAHVERPSYWPNPKADCSIKPCAGGKVPKARSLTSALDDSRKGRTRVVCKANSMTKLRASVKHARKHGYNVRPTVHKSFSAERGRHLIAINKQLFKRCAFRRIQAAVNASHNHDRVVVMPGLYKEKVSRRQPTHDPACAKYNMESDGGDPGALSHDFQIHCPNDANLVAVIGRGPDTAPPPDKPHVDRHGIPNVGKCIRCNLQLEGSGVNADDVIVEAGRAKAGNGGPSAVGHKKDVGIFVDRADGFVLRKMTIRHAREHDIYILETDGYRIEHFKTFYAGAYGVLTFVEDHGLMQHCEAAGNGDSGLYPGSGADSTDKRYKKFYPKYRFSQVVRYCDSHHNTSGFSGTDSHGTLITRNNFYDNALGYTTDVFTAPGHPGFPQHGNVVRHNKFYDNNFNPFAPDSDVEPFIPAPVGTGLWLAGGNANVVSHNWFWDNWRRGVMVFAVPDATVCGPPPVGSSTPVPGCKPTGLSTSYDNSLHHNRMGVTPGGKAKPNGLDLWWDAFPTTTGNCWWANKGVAGQPASSSPANLPDCDGGTKPGQSIGLGSVPNITELVACLAGFTVVGYPEGDPTTCTWTTTPAKPGNARPAARSAQPDQTAQAQQFAAICAQGLSPRLCAPFKSWLATLAQPLARAIDDAAAGIAGVKPAASEGRLSSFTCSWWRSADKSHRVGMVQRIRTFATGPIDGSTPYGYGAGMADSRAYLLFEDRCSTFQAGPFALYKLYGAAAPFAAFTN